MDKPTDPTQTASAPPPSREATPDRLPTPSNHCCQLRHSRVSPTPCCCRRDECQGLQGSNTQTDTQESPAPHTPPRIAELLHADLVQSPPLGQFRPPRTPERSRKSRLSRNKTPTLTRSRSFRKILESPTKNNEESSECRIKNEERTTTEKTLCSRRPEGTSSPRQ